MNFSTKLLPILMTAFSLAIPSAIHAEDGITTPTMEGSVLSTVPTPSPASTPTARPAMASQDGLRLAGFPMGAIQLEPALAAVFQLTPEQAASLQKAHAETIEQAAKDLETNSDTRQKQALTQRANQDFRSLRDSILSDQQITLITIVQEAAKAAQLDAKSATSMPGLKSLTLKERFLNHLKSALNSEQLALLDAAAGKPR